MENFDEASEEIKNRRRKRAIKVFITEGTMVILIIALVVLTTFFATGHKIQPGDDWTIVRTGLVQFQTKPSGANLTIDGESIFGWTDMSRSLSEGEHEIVLTREGYDSWSKKIWVNAGLYYRLNYPRLFLTEKKTEKFDEIPEGFKISFAKDGNIALLYSDSDPNWKVFEINNENPKVREFKVKDIFSEVREGETDLGIKIEAWSGDNERVLISRNGEFALLDINDSEKNINLTKKFGMNFSQVRIANDSANVLYAVFDGNLRQVDINEEKISSILVRNIKNFDNLKLDLIYVADDNEDGEVEYGVYRDGEKSELKMANESASRLREVSEGEVEEKAKIPSAKQIKDIKTTEYFGEFYTSLVSKDGDWVILKSNRFLGKKEDFELVFYKKLEGAVRKLEERGGGELFVVEIESGEEVFDIETENVVKITTFLDAKWFDEHMVYNISEDGALLVMDFDRENERKLSEEALPRTEIVISKNNRWLYFISKDGKLSRVTISY